MAKLDKRRRVYRAPVLAKGPKLSDIAAEPPKSLSVCWVARAAFGAEDIRWRVFRAWLMDDAPAWFRKAYIRHGEAVGAWLQDRDFLRSLVRRAMVAAVRQKLR